jgi:hypothetical protein
MKGRVRGMFKVGALQLYTLEGEWQCEILWMRDCRLLLWMDAVR